MSELVTALRKQGNTVEIKRVCGGCYDVAINGTLFRVEKCDPEQSGDWRLLVAAGLGYDWHDGREAVDAAILLYADS